MLTTSIVKPSTQELISINKSRTIDRINGIVNKVYKAKSKNIVIPDFLAKSKSLVESSSKSDFLTLETILAFAKLK